MSKLKKLTVILMLMLVMFVTSQPIVAGPPINQNTAAMTCIRWYCCFGSNVGETLDCFAWFVERFIMTF